MVSAGKTQKFCDCTSSLAKVFRSTLLSIIGSKVDQKPLASEYGDCISAVFCCCLFSDAVSGASNDWAKAVAGVQYAYAYEFRPATQLKRSGFILPPEEIVPNSEEVFASLVAMADEVAKTL